MCRFPPAFVALPAVLLSACATSTTTDPARLPDGQWELDAEHSSVNWSVMHFGLSHYVGRFDTVDASLDFDPEHPEAARLTATVEVASISTGDPEFDERLANDWLGAETHPQIVFESERIEVTGENTGRVEGTLSLNGRSRPAVMTVQFNGGLDHPLEGRPAVGFSAELTIDRTEFGVGSLATAVVGNAVGNNVRLYIEAEFLKEGDPDD